MTDRPILFSAPMVCALIEGRKTQTRRLISTKPSHRAINLFDGTWSDSYVLDSGNAEWRDRIVRYAIGDRLWVKEAFNAFQFSQDGDDAWPVKIPTLEECKEADDLGHRYGAPQIVFRESDRARKWFSGQKWRSPIFMPRWASRLTLTVTDVRVQRLQDISELDARAEGVDHTWPRIGRDAYRDLWNSLHGPDAWDANPWVAALTFTVARHNIDGGK